MKNIWKTIGALSLLTPAAFAMVSCSSSKQEEKEDFGHDVALNKINYEGLKEKFNSYNYADLASKGTTGYDSKSNTVNLDLASIFEFAPSFPVQAPVVHVEQFDKVLQDFSNANLQIPADKHFSSFVPPSISSNYYLYEWLTHSKDKANNYSLSKPGLYHIRPDLSDGNLNQVTSPSWNNKYLTSNTPNDPLESILKFVTDPYNIASEQNDQQSGLVLFESSKFVDENDKELDSSDDSGVLINTGLTKILAPTLLDKNTNTYVIREFDNVYKYSTDALNLTVTKTPLTNKGHYFLAPTEADGGVKLNFKFSGNKYTFELSGNDNYLEKGDHTKFSYTNGILKMPLGKISVEHSVRDATSGNAVQKTDTKDLYYQIDLSDDGFVQNSLPGFTSTYLHSIRSKLTFVQYKKSIFNLTLDSNGNVKIKKGNDNNHIEFDNIFDPRIFEFIEPYRDEFVAYFRPSRVVFDEFHIFTFYDIKGKGHDPRSTTLLDSSHFFLFNLTDQRKPSKDLNINGHFNENPEIWDSNVTLDLNVKDSTDSEYTFYSFFEEQGFLYPLPNDLAGFYKKRPTSESEAQSWMFSTKGDQVDGFSANAENWGDEQTLADGVTKSTYNLPANIENIRVYASVSGPREYTTKNHFDILPMASQTKAGEILTVYNSGIYFLPKNQNVYSTKVPTAPIGDPSILNNINYLVDRITGEKIFRKNFFDIDENGNPIDIATLTTDQRNKYYLPRVLVGFYYGNEKISLKELNEQIKNNTADLFISKWIEKRFIIPGDKSGSESETNDKEKRFVYHNRAYPFDSALNVDGIISFSPSYNLDIASSRKNKSISLLESTKELPIFLNPDINWNGNEPNHLSAAEVDGGIDIDIHSQEGLARFFKIESGSKATWPLDKKNFKIRISWNDQVLYETPQEVSSYDLLNWYLVIASGAWGAIYQDFLYVIQEFSDPRFISSSNPVDYVFFVSETATEKQKREAISWKIAKILDDLLHQEADL